MAARKKFQWRQQKKTNKFDENERNVSKGFASDANCINKWNLHENRLELVTKLITPQARSKDLAIISIK